jgi:hypothetical protein
MGRNSLEATKALRMRAVRAVRDARLAFFFWLGFFAGAACFFVAFAEPEELFVAFELLAAVESCPRTNRAP